MLAHRFKVPLCKSYLKQLPCSMQHLLSDEQKPQQTSSAGESLCLLIKSALLAILAEKAQLRQGM